MGLDQFSFYFQGKEIHNKKLLWIFKNTKIKVFLTFILLRQQADIDKFNNTTMLWKKIFCERTTLFQLLGTVIALWRL